MEKEIIKLRKAQVKIALEIKRICEKNDIQYFLDAGSMLGAVRHGGFIPWDDDIDIGMTASEYQRFLEVAPRELGEEFFIDNYLVNKECGLVYTKVRLKNTVYIENKGNALAQHNEIFVDVFPYFYISDNLVIRKINAFILAFLSQSILSKSGYKVWKGDKWYKRIKFIPSDIVGKIVSKEYLFLIINKIYSAYDNTDNMCVHAGSAYNYWFFPKEMFDDYVEIGFEGYTFNIPSKYDLYLSTAYGNYMEIPPIEKRVTHQITRLEFGNVNVDEIAIKEDGGA